MSSYEFIISSYCKRDLRYIRISEAFCKDSGLRAGDHISINVSEGHINITKDFKCRICQGYTNQLISKVVLGCDDEKYHSLEHCVSCSRDVPDYSRRVKLVDLPAIF